MQRKLIKVGEAYAVSPERSTRHSQVVKGTVVALDGEYEYRRRRAYSSTETKHDGIVVRFDEPMFSSHSGWEPLARAEERYTPERVEEARKRAITQAVLPEARMVREPWADYAERMARFEAARDESLRNADAVADKAEPRVAAVQDALSARGMKVVIRPHHQKGVERQRTVGAMYTLSLDQIEELLGVTAAKEVTEPRRRQGYTATEVERMNRVSG